MNVDCISLKDFRNIEDQTVDFSRGISAFVGQNAQGKTNLIEAIYLLATSKSFRVLHQRDMISHGKQRAEIKAQISGEGIPFELKFALDAKRGREIYKNGVKIEKLSEFLGLCRAVLFCPEHLSLIKDGPSKRRSFIDSALCQIRPYYASMLNEFIKTEMQRSSLLKQMQNKKGLEDYLSVWNERLARSAVKIVFLRNEYINKLSSLLPEEYKNIAGNDENIKISYQSDIFSENASEEEMINDYIKMLDTDKEKDIRYGYTSRGPHRDDLNIFINSYPAKIYASQGQQRSAVLALKLCEGDISKSETGKSPIYLFDDVLSELDEKRREFITKGLIGKQIIMTGTDEKDFYFTDKITFVNKGKFNAKELY